MEDFDSIDIFESLNLNGQSQPSVVQHTPDPQLDDQVSLERGCSTDHKSSICIDSEQSAATSWCIHRSALVARRK